MREVEKIQAIREETSKEEFEEEEHTLVTPDVGKLLVIWRALHAKEVPLEPNQREQIFHTRCTIGSKVCEFIIDEGSCTNVASMTLIDKLQVPTKVYPTPYTLRWLKQGSEVTVSKQALISFSVGPYCGEVLCDVLPMDACHILFRRPWLFDNHVMHDGNANTYALKFKGCNLTLTPYYHPNLSKLNREREVKKASIWVRHRWRESLIRASLYLPYLWLNQTQMRKWSPYTLLLNYSWESLRMFLPTIYHWGSLLQEELSSKLISYLVLLFPTSWLIGVILMRQKELQR